MFRKRTKKAVNLRRKRGDDGEHDKEGGDDDDEAIGIAIRNTMKKQKILASMPLTSTGATPKSNVKKGYKESEDQSLSQQMPPQASELSVLASKHVGNMEAFIEQQMAQQMKTTRTNDAVSNEDKNSAESLKTSDANNGINTEEDLYRQLARETTNTGGRNDTTNNNGRPQQQHQQHDGDQGDGGAALLVGTGIAEVILPATNHRPVVAPTGNMVRNKNNSSLSSAVPEEERHKHSLPNTTPKPFVKFRKTNNSLQNNENNTYRIDNKNRDNSSREQSPPTSSTIRKGFDAYRGKIPTTDHLEEGNNDKRDRHQNNRWKTGKDRDDQVYSHFLKNALNGMGRR